MKTFLAPFWDIAESIGRSNHPKQFNLLQPLQAMEILVANRLRNRKEISTFNMATLVCFNLIRGI